MELLVPNVVGDILHQKQDHSLLLGTKVVLPIYVAFGSHKIHAQDVLPENLQFGLVIGRTM